MSKILGLSAVLPGLLTAMLALPVNVTAGENELPYPMKVPLELSERLYQELTAQERALNQERNHLSPQYKKHNAECTVVEQGTPQAQQCLKTKEQLTPKISKYLERIAAHTKAVDMANRRNCQETQVLYELHQLEKILVSSKDQQARRLLKNKIVLNEKLLDKIRSDERIKDTAIQQLLPANVDCSKIGTDWYQHSPQAVMGSLSERLPGEAFIKYRDRWFRIGADTPIGIGDEIRTGPKDPIRVDLRDGSAVELGPNTTIVMQEEGLLAKLKSHFGKLHAIVKKRLNRRFVVRFSDCSYSVKGTEFTIEADREGSTIIMVFEGAVEFSGHDSSTSPVTIVAGQRAVVLPQGVIQSLDKVDLNQFVRWWETGMEESHSP